jgi:hypothetical protein
MTVGELIKELQALPQDMDIMVINEDRQDPIDITLVSRGSWTDDLDADDIEPEFLFDDENGTVGLLVTW